MLPRIRLEISLALSGQPTVSETAVLGAHVGGRRALLGWLETQLGIMPDGAGHAERVRIYAELLEEHVGGSEQATRAYAESFALDRWTTATHLLSLREQLRLHGWDGKKRDDLPRLVNDLAEFEEDAAIRIPTEADRLDEVLTSLERGQILPDHACVLHESIEEWPIAWRDVLARLQTASAPESAPGAKPATALRALQSSLLAKPVRESMDESVCWIDASSATAACEFVAASFTRDHRDPDRRALLAETAILCADETIARRLDAAFDRSGLPTAGSSLSAHRPSAFQVLPLALQLCWKPVDPTLLLDFLSLRVSPIGGYAGRKLAEALSDQPGLGSRAWDEARAELTDPENDRDGKTSRKLSEWLDLERVPAGEPLPPSMVKSVALRIEQWAHRYASARAKVHEDDLTRTLFALAAQARNLQEIVSGQNSPVSGPQLALLLETAQSGGHTVQPTRETAAGPRLVLSLSEIGRPIKRLIWLGLGGTRPSRSPWSAAELGLLKAAGLSIDDGSVMLGHTREAERRGLMQIEESLLAISLPSDEGTRLHPFWLQACAALHPPDQRDAELRPTALDTLLADCAPLPHAPWKFPTESHEIVPAQPARALWSAPPDTLDIRAFSSSTSLSSRLGCPLQWVLNYQAKVRPGAIASIPQGNQLKGTFLHDVLDAVFCDSEAELPDEAEAARLTLARFDARIERDAAPLALPSKEGERRELREQLGKATQALVRSLHRGGYRIVAMEKNFEQTDGRIPIRGFIDCLAERPDGGQAVIDFKYSYSDYYRRGLANGSAVQLATYAAAVGGTNEDAPPVAVAYLMLPTAAIHTPESGALAGATEDEILIGAPPILSVWRTFQEAVEGADGWLSGGDSVPARPLQNPSEWPEGVALAIPNPDQPSPCRFCDYGLLCGRGELV